MGNQQPVVGGGPGDGSNPYGYPMDSSTGGGAPNQHHHHQHQHHAHPQQQQQQQPPLHRASSDASMTLLDDHTNMQNTMHPNSAPSDGTTPTATDWLDDDTVPTVFRWEHGGRHVYITGTFNGWSRQIPMHRSGNDFTYIHNLQRSKHAFKFIVDDEWRFAPDQPTVADLEGRINNFIDVSEFEAYTGDLNFEKETAAADCANKQSSAGTTDNTTTAAADTTHHDNHHHNKDDDDHLFSTTEPDVYDNYTKEPPPLPPHLRHIILNKPAAALDTAALPVPQHVALNHLYCTAIRDNMMVLGITQRFQTKFVTTVYYAPCASK